MKCAIVGCGYVADYYAATRHGHPGLEWIGAFDRDTERLDTCARRWRVRAYRSLEELCADGGVELILNLTNPRNHLEVTRQCLLSGKHVYSEKPLAMTVADASSLAELAAAKGVQLASAPCSVLGETAQSIAHAIRHGAIGKVRLVYGNFEDGMIAPRRSPWNWKNDAGVPWPARDEFEVGCTFEHGGYVLTWLATWFGQARTVTAFSSVQVPDKGIAVSGMAPDFSVGCIQYPDGVVARLTFGLVAPRDKSLTIIGDDGVLFVGNVRDDSGPIYIRRAELPQWQSRIAARFGWLDTLLGARYEWRGVEALFQKRYPLRRAPTRHVSDPGKPVDFLLGPSEVAAAVTEQRASRLSAPNGVHLVELTERLQHPERFSSPDVVSPFCPIPPMPWAM